MIAWWWSFPLLAGGFLLGWASVVWIVWIGLRG